MAASPTSWTDPSFLVDAHAWIHDRMADLGLETTGAIQQVHDRPWSTILRVPTDTGHLYFKANAPALCHEARIVAFVAQRRRELVPVPLAVDFERGWMLMADAGARLRELISAEGTLTRWLDFLPLYAGLQLDLAGAVDELLALGAPDLRLAKLPARFEQLLNELDRLPVLARSEGDEMRRLRSAVPKVAAMCRELAGFGIAETLQHDDLNDGQVFWCDGRYLLLDWGDACVSHPFFSMSVTLEGVISWGVDDLEDSVDVTSYREAYLSPFAVRRDVTELRDACTIALRLGWICRAVNGHVTGLGDVQATMRRLRMFLERRPD